MATYTANYGLHQWEASDNFLRTDFNTDFGIIDGALGEKAEFVTGAYAGDGAAARTVSLGFTPKAVLVMREDGTASYTNNSTSVYGGLAAEGTPVKKSGQNAVAVITGGFQVAHQGSPTDIYTNSSGQNYHYLALR